MKPRRAVRREQDYVLGTNRDELVRLGLQHQLWARCAADAWERAGFGPGKKLLDVGCGRATPASIWQRALGHGARSAPSTSPSGLSVISNRRPRFAASQASRLPSVTWSD